jgi:hypothetical protein
MKKIIFASLVSLFCLESQADIAPDPIRAKGITIKEQTEIIMTYEKIVVDLTLDSSFVCCYFRLHNEGKARKIQIGYPNMSYYSNSDFRQFRFNPINVYENGEKINDVRFYKPDTLNLRNNDNHNKPWYLWDTHFDENETRVIILSYSLPHGVIKNNLYYSFDYLLSSGAGWKGNIDTAEIVVNLKNLDKNLILKTSPDNFTISGNQIVWKLYGFEPTSKDDISIKYEMEKGQYEQRLKKNSSIWILNDTIVLSNDIRDENTLSNINPNDLALISIKKDSETAKKKFPKVDSSNGLILIYTKTYAIEKISQLINSSVRRKKNMVKFASISDFEENYSFTVNQKFIKKGTPIYEELLNIDKKKIIDISISGQGTNKYEINIKTSQ